MSTTQLPDLPSAEEYREAWSKIADTNEFVVEPLSSRVFEAINFEGEQEVTLADIGALVVFADDLRKWSEDWAELAAKLAQVAVDDLATIEMEGEQVNVARYNRYGSDNREGVQRSLRALLNA